MIKTAQAHGNTAAELIASLAAALDVESCGRPDFLVLHFGVGTDATDLHRAARERFAGTAIHGGSSLLGVMTEAGVSIDSGAGVGALAIWDRNGSFGTASGDLGADAQASAREVAMAALAAAHRIGEIPDLVWLTVAPGREEAVLAGLRSVFGETTPIVGGSSADNDASGRWAQFGPQAVHRDGLVASVLFSSSAIAHAYESGYTPTGESGLVTRVEGRRLHEIDGQPAASVYCRWTDGAVLPATDSPRSILTATTLRPLGRITRHVAGVPFHLLAHPAMSYPDGSLELFATVAHGDRLWQMQGSADGLVARAARIAWQARGAAGTGIVGALVVFCGGGMLAVRDRMDEVRAGINDSLGDVPWLGVFTYGEQGVPTGGKPKHGNLMISCTVFEG